LLTVFFTIEGVASVMYALEHRKELTGRWEWMLVSGVVDLILAFIILTGLPGTAAWALGLLVGINMLFGGSSMIAMALHARGSGLPSLQGGTEGDGSFRSGCAVTVRPLRHRPLDATGRARAPLPRQERC
jgi:hypothetical protein